MTTPAAGRPGRSLDVLILLAGLLAVRCGVGGFMGRESAPATSSAPVEALSSLAIEAQGAVAGDTRALNNFESSLRELKTAAAADPQAAFVKDARYNQIVSNAGTVLQARSALADA